MTTDAPPDEDLMLAYAAGDAGAFAPLHDRHTRAVHRFFLRQGASPAQADDLLQDTWMTVIRQASGYEVRARFTTWLYTIARSRLVDHWRRTQRQVLLHDAANDPDDEAHAIDAIADSSAVQPDIRAMSRQQGAAFVAAVEALPAVQREAFLLQVEGDLSLDEIAVLQAVGAETVKSRLRYAMKRLRFACADWLEPADPVVAVVGGLHEA